MRIRILKTRLLAGAGVALALSITIHAAVNQTIGVGNLAHSDLFGGPATVTMRTLTILPEEVLGWHRHPGIGAYTIVTQGTLVVEDGCGTEQTYTPGQAFLEPPDRVHRGKNLSPTEFVSTAQTFTVPAGTLNSVPTTQLCGAPLNLEECRDHEWMKFNYPRTFVSQGDCQQYVITRK